MRDQISQRRLSWLIVPGSSLAAQSWWPRLHQLINSSYQNKKSQSFPTSWTRLDIDPVAGAAALAQELGPNGHMAVAFLDEHAEAEAEAEAKNGSGNDNITNDDDDDDDKQRQPVACGGVLPFRGIINPLQPAEDSTTKDPTPPGHLPKLEVLVNGEVTSPTGPSTDLGGSFEQWEICCFCVHPAHRGRGLSGALLQHIESWVRRAGGSSIGVDYVIEETAGFWTKSGFVRVEGQEETVIRKGFRVSPDKEALERDIRIAVGVKVL